MLRADTPTPPHNADPVKRIHIIFLLLILGGFAMIHSGLDYMQTNTNTHYLCSAENTGYNAQAVPAAVASECSNVNSGWTSSDVGIVFGYIVGIVGGAGLLRARFDRVNPRNKPRLPGTPPASQTGS